MEAIHTPLAAAQSLTQVAQSNLSTPEGSYILSLCPSGPDALAAISSDNSLRVFDKRTLRLLPGVLYQNIHPAKSAKDESGPTDLCEYADGSSGLLVTSGRDGLVKVWDRRKGSVPAMVLKSGDKLPPLGAVACSPQTNLIAAGTDLAMRAASINFWDIRSPANMAMSYTESHNDDITVLQFSPFNPRLLLSGSTDTLVNIYDTTQKDEEEALKQVINHGSVHRAGFLSNNAAYVLSHDEQFAIHPLNAYVRGEATTVEQGEKVAEEPSPVDFKDVRDQLRCNYVAQVIRSNENVYIASGMLEQKRFDLMPVVKEPRWRFDESAVVRLPGAHGEEVVREVLLDESSRSLYTCGEDGFVRVWQMPDTAPEEPKVADTKMEEDNEDENEAEDEVKETKKRKKHSKEKHGLGKEKRKKKKEHRYKPY